MKNKLITISEAIKWTNKISTYEYLSDSPTSRMFMVFKDRYNDDRRYFAYFMPFENYTEDDMYMHKIFNNVKEEEFMFICVINEALDDTNAIFYTNQDFINMVETDESFSFDDCEIEDVFEHYYISKGIEFYGRYQNEPYNYISSIDEHKVICNHYDTPELISMNNEIIKCLTHFTDNKRCLKFSDFEYMFVYQDIETDEFDYNLDSIYNFIPFKFYEKLQNKYDVKFVYIYNDINDTNSYCTDPDFINYYKNLDKQYISTHYNIDIIKDYFKQYKNIEL